MSSCSTIDKEHDNINYESTCTFIQVSQLNVRRFRVTRDLCKMIQLNIYFVWVIPPGLHH